MNTRTGEVQNVPIGIDPGWNHNTGVMRSRTKLNRLIDRLDDPQLDPGLARNMVQEGIRDLSAGQAGTAFLDFLTGAVAGDWPVAVVPQKVLGAIRGESRILRLSQYTANKQAGRIEGKIGHPDVVAEDYLKAQRAMDGGRTFRSDKSSSRSIGAITRRDSNEWEGVKTFHLCRQISGHRLRYVWILCFWEH